MSQKRNEREDSSSSDDKRPRTISSFSSVVLQVMKLQRFQKFIEPVLEPLIRQVVKEETDAALKRYWVSMKRNIGKDINVSETRNLKLKFSTTISLPVFTGAWIEGEGCTRLEVALVDALSEVVSNVPQSSASVEIVVLEGDFDCHDSGNWTYEEFTSGILRTREHKKSLLIGEVLMNLVNGKSLVGDVSITDNSSWTRSRKFRLGVRFVDNLCGIRIREAISEPFIVRDHRGEVYKKNYPPSLSDEVWRLEKIGKDGAFHKRLSNEKVYDVQDFLILLSIDPTGIRNILGTGMSSKKWEVTVAHALTCTFDNKLYLYGSTNSLPKNGVIFNLIGEMMGILSDDHYVPTDKLSESEKADAHELLVSAFKSHDKNVLFDSKFEMTFVDQSSSNFLSEDRDRCLSTVKSGRRKPLCSMGGMSSFECLDGDTLDLVSPRCYSFPDQFTDDRISDTESLSQTYSANEYLQYLDTDFSIGESTDLQSKGDACIPCPGKFVNITKWRLNLLFSVLKWYVLIKRIVANSKKNTC